MIKCWQHLLSTNTFRINDSPIRMFYPFLIKILKKETTEAEDQCNGTLKKLRSSKKLIKFGFGFYTIKVFLDETLTVLPPGPTETLERNIIHVVPC